MDVLWDKSELLRWMGNVMSYLLSTREVWDM